MNWTLCAHRSELAAPGDYVVLRGGPDHIAAVNLNGSVIAFNNICKHRGSRIFLNSHGNRQLKCPYHGFEGMAAVGEQYLTQWIGDFLFVGYGSGRIEDDLHDFGPLLDGLSKRIHARHSFDELPMPCDWTVAVENSLEDMHVEHVHPDTFGKLGMKLDEIERRGNNSVALYTLQDERTVKGLKSIEKYFEEVDSDHYFHIFLYPYTCISSVGGFSFSIQHYMPSGGFTSLHTRLYSGKTLPGAPNLGWFYAEAAQFNRLVFAQDSAVCANVASDGTMLTENERRVKWFREARR